MRQPGWRSTASGLRVSSAYILEPPSCASARESSCRTMPAPGASRPPSPNGSGSLWSPAISTPSGICSSRRPLGRAGFLLMPTARTAIRSSRGGPGARAAGARAVVTEVTAGAGTLLVGLEGTGAPAAREVGGAAERWQVLTLRGGRIVDIRGFDDRAAAAGHGAAWSARLRQDGPAYRWRSQFAVSYCSQASMGRSPTRRRANLRPRRAGPAEPQPSEYSAFSPGL